MPVYNAEQHLGEAIESILQQSFGDFEFLIIDDGSSDGSTRIVLSYDDKRIRLLQNPENCGLSITLNRGIAEARGQYIARMDSDDISLPQRLQKQVAFMWSHPQVAICGSWIELFGSDGGVWQYPTESSAIKARLLFSSSFAHPTVIMNRKMLLDNNLLFNEYHRYAQDYALWVRATELLPVANIGEVLLNYRCHQQQISSAAGEAQKQSVESVHRNQLLAMGVKFFNHEIRLHSRIAASLLETTPEFVTAVEEWLLKVAAANEQSRYVAGEALKYELFRRWWRVCRHAGKDGQVAEDWLWNSPLSRGIELKNSYLT